MSRFHTNFPSYADHYHISLLHPLICGYLRFFHNLTDATLVPTIALQSNLQQKGFHNLHVVGRGIDLTRFSPNARSNALRREWGIGKDGLAILYVGRLAKEKNLQLALNIFTQRHRFNSGAGFILVGDDPLRKKLPSDRPDLIITGAKIGNSLAKYYASADIFLFPSATETFGNVTLEALASGLPVVAFDYAAAAEFGRNNINGLFVPFGSEGAFVSAAKRLAANSKLRNQMRCAARKSVQAVTWLNVCSRLESILHSRTKNHQQQVTTEAQGKPQHV